MDTAKNNEAQEDVNSQGGKDQAIMLKGKFPYIIWANREVDKSMEIWIYESQ